MEWPLSAKQVRRFSALAISGRPNAPLLFVDAIRVNSIPRVSLGPQAPGQMNSQEGMTFYFFTFPYPLYDVHTSCLAPSPMFHFFFNENINFISSVFIHPN